MYRNMHKSQFIPFVSDYGARYQGMVYLVPADVLRVQGGRGHSVLPRYVENSLCVSCTDLAVFLSNTVSCKFSDNRAYHFLKITRDYHFVESSLSSDQALNIHGQYEHVSSPRHDSTRYTSVRYRHLVPGGVPGTPYLIIQTL